MTGESDEAKQEVAACIRDGGKLYWHEKDDGEFTRVEYSNVKFVFDAIGEKIQCFETVLSTGI